MTKVTNTKIYKDQSGNDVLGTIGRWVLISPKVNYRMFILISETEKIKIGDDFLYGNSIMKCTQENKNLIDISCEKILALPENISPKIFIRGGDECIVVCEKIRNDNSWKGEDLFNYYIKLDQNNHVQILPFEEESVSWDEVVVLFNSSYKKHKWNKNENDMRNKLDIFIEWAKENNYELKKKAK